MIHTLNTWDTNLFLFLNGFHTDFFDRFMYLFSAKLTWIPLYAAVLYVLIRQWKRDAIWIILTFVLCIAIADQVSSGIIKDLVQRPRPSQSSELQGLVHLVNNYRGGRFGFVSSHAANAIGFALLSSLLFKHKFYTLVIFTWAILTAYSRIYLGVHFPLDIAGGTLVGIMSALTCFWLLRRYRPSLKNADDKLAVNVPTVVFGITVLGIISYSFISI